MWAADDPIWQTIYPPNGFNCRCKVRALSARDLERRGLSVNTKSRVKTERAQVRLNKVTGERVIREVHTARWTGPDGQRHVFQPDDGWGHAPRMPDPSPPPPRPGPISAARPPILPDLPTRPAIPRLSKAPTRAAAQEQVFSLLGLSEDVPQRQLTTPVGAVTLNREQARHITADHPGETRERFANQILPTLTDPDEVWEFSYKGKMQRHYFSAWDDRHIGFAVVRGEENQYPTLHTFFSTKDGKYINRRRIGTLIYEREKAEGR